MALLRSLVYAAIFYPMTALWVLAGIAASLFGRRPTLAVVLSWVKIHHWLARHLLKIRIRAEGDIPAGAHLIAVKHQSMLETRPRSTPGTRRCLTVAQTTVPAASRAFTATAVSATCHCRVANP